MTLDCRRKCWLWFPIRFTKYEIIKKNEDLELVITKGLIAKNIDKVKLFKINDLTYNRTLGNFLFGVANIIVDSSDSSAKRCKIAKIRGARQFLELLEERVNEERKRVKVSYSETNLVR